MKLNAVETVEMLREYLQSSAPNQLGAKFSNAVWDATFLIESQSAEIAELKAQLAASQRETRAAVADIPRCCATCAYAKANSGSQELCPWFDDCNQVDGDHWQWRGPQEAGNGETE